MSIRTRVLAILAMLGVPGTLTAATLDPGAEPVYVLNHTMNRIDGTPESLETYKGKVILIVNVASECGLTEQYPALEKLYDDKKDQGFVILAFPANNFMGQEPGTNEEIAKFCTTKYDVSFPMFEKISVKGDDTCDLYKQLTALPAPLGGEPEWNFAKFIVDRRGNVAARFHPKVTPDATELTARIDELLAAK